MKGKSQAPEQLGFDALLKIPKGTPPEHIPYLRYCFALMLGMEPLR